jgi:DNA helicase II / ATP-dependent DNA helicase PcrA
MKYMEKQKLLASEICNKPDLIPIETCHESWGQTNPLCNEYEYCRILEKSPEQTDYAFSPDTENVFLRACPGSGKTEVVALKTAYTIRKWKHNIGGIAVLTFTNNAADVCLKYIPTAIGASEAPLEEIESMNFNGKLGIDVYNDIIKPELKILRG